MVSVYLPSLLEDAQCNRAACIQAFILKEQYVVLVWFWFCFGFLGGGGRHCFVETNKGVFVFTTRTNKLTFTTTQFHTD